MATVNVRYIVSDMPASVAFYKDLGFEVVMNPGPGFAMLSLGDLRLLLNTAGGGGGAGQSMPDGQAPQPGGWNRFQLVTEDIEGLVSRLRAAGASFRNEIVTGNGGKQILLNDPSGNCVEIFEPFAR